MYKNKSRFAHSWTMAGRRLSSYPKSRKFRGTRDMLGGAQFEAGTAYVRQIAPLIDAYLNGGLNYSEIAEDLRKRDIGNPCRTTWTAVLVEELVTTTKSDRARRMKKPARQRTKK
jgi:hypothetical protein